MALAGAGLLELGLVHGTVWLLLGLALAGAGLGLFTPSNNASIMSGAPSGHTGLVSGLLNMSRGAGTALGVAVAGALYAAGGFTLALVALGVAGLAAGAALQLDDPSTLESSSGGGPMRIEARREWGEHDQQRG